MQIERSYVIDENNTKVAVQIDIKTFEKIEEVLENYGLMKFISCENEEEALDLAEAKAYYEALDKAK